MEREDFWEASRGWSWGHGYTASGADGDATRRGLFRGQGRPVSGLFLLNPDSAPDLPANAVQGTRAAHLIVGL